MIERLRKILNRISQLVSAKLGRCARCMRLSLQGALVGWVAVAGAYQVNPVGWIWSVPFVLAVPFTILWLGHIAAFATREVRRGRSTQVQPQNQGVPMTISDRGLRTANRRQALAIFVTGTVMGVLASLSVPRAASAMCNGRCGSGTCECNTGRCGGSDRYVCCPSDAPYLNHCDCQCYASTGFNCSSYTDCAGV